MKLLSEIIKVALNSLYANKLKSGLTILGIVVGIFSIISISTIIEMMQTTMSEGISGFGQNSFYIQKYPAVRTGGPREWLKYRNREEITYEEYQRFNELYDEPVVMAADQSTYGVIIKFQNEETNPNIGFVGGTEHYFEVNNMAIESGRAFNETDIRNYSKCVVVGQDIVKKLFKNLDPVGQEVKIDGNVFRIIGVTEEKGEMFGQSMDNFVIVPITTFQMLYGNEEESVTITVKIPDLDEMDNLVDKAKGVFRYIRKVPAGEENDFEVFSNDAIMENVNNITAGFRVGSIVIAAIALLAAGVGIMNIMLVSVTERTREIGIRKSIGAKKSNILIQFIVEAIVLCQLGGLIGIILGVGIGNIVGMQLNVNAMIPYNWVFIGVMLCTIIGVTFGTYPAYKAANLDPIEALRYE